MAQQAQTKVGIVEAASPRSGHTTMDDMVPAHVTVEHAGMGVVMDFTHGTSYEMNRPLIGMKESYLKRVPELVKERGWRGVVVMGAPVQRPCKGHQHNSRPAWRETLVVRAKTPGPSGASYRVR